MHSPLPYFIPLDIYAHSEVEVLYKAYLKMLAILEFWSLGRFGVVIVFY
jgi:hypothetical protein